MSPNQFDPCQFNPWRVGIACATELRDLEPERCYDDPNLVRRLLRDAMLQAGLGQADPDVPLSDLIKPGQSVLLKPNWVYHRNQGPWGKASLVTHPEFLRQTLLEVTAAKPRKVTLGDAPIQGCDWTSLVSLQFRSQVHQIEKQTGVKIELVDFRRTVTKTDDLGDGVEIEQRELDRYLLFDLGTDSCLEPISQPRGRFRVTSYDPRELAKRHQPGRHQYLLCKEAFEADVVIQLPKLKTHGKAGITGAIKNLVGLNGHKDYLPHHRVGGSESGGDCYQGRSLRLRTAEWLLDMANQNLGRWMYRPLKRLVPVPSRFLRNPPAGGLEGSWHGNNTCWRMVLDLNRILRFGTIDGRLSDTQQRTIYSLTDAIVCGQGNGPLAPEPLPVGAVTFASHSVVADWVHCVLLGFDPNRLPLVREARLSERWSLLEANGQPQVFFNSQSLSTAEMRDTIGVNAKPPKGWEGHVELEVPVS